MITKQELIDFEADIAEQFCNGKILAPIHLSDGNEDQLIDIFNAYINKDDWVFSTWRSHYHALLHGIPKEEVRRQIMAGNSMAINSDNPKFFSSAIVGGCLPIAIGVAMEIKRKGEDRHVHIFVGDMAAQTGIFHECHKYAQNLELPIAFRIEDNGVSVGADTKAAWGLDIPRENDYSSSLNRYYYKKEKYPHVGAGKWVTF